MHPNKTLYAEPTAARNACWSLRLTLAIDGFNPTAIDTNETLTVIYRQKHGTYARPYARDLHEPAGAPYQIHPSIEDCRPVHGTRPPILIGAIYGRRTTQAALILTTTPAGLRPINRPIPLQVTPTKARPAPKPEKNWLFWTPTPTTLAAIYDPHAHRLAYPSDDPATWSVTTPVFWTRPTWADELNTPLRGSTPPVALANGHLLTLWHLKDRTGGYWTGANLLHPSPPYRPIATTNRPLFTPKDATEVSPHWPPNTCVFPMALDITTDDTARIWAGDSDKYACVYLCPISKLLNSMEPIL